MLHKLNHKRVDIKIRWREHKSMSEIVRKAINEYIEKHSEGNDSFRLDIWVNDSTFKAVPLQSWSMIKVNGLIMSIVAMIRKRGK